MSSDPLDLASVIEDIRRTADAHTASGMYDAGFEDDLRSHFARLLDRDDGRDRFDAVHAALAHFDRDREFSRARIDHSSGLPGGEVMHKTAGKIVGRQINGLVAQLNSFSGALTPVLRQLAAAVSDPPAHVHADVLLEIDTLQDRLAAVERTVARADAVIRQLENSVPAVLAHLSELDGLSARLKVIEERERRRSYDPPFSSVAFGNATRGDADSIRAEYGALADSLIGVPGEVLDIGAGRGEFLDLLTTRNVAARGVEIDTELVALARDAGSNVQLVDGVEALRACAPCSLGAVVLLHVIEHLYPNELLEVVSLAHDRLAIGGKLVLETPNPQSLYVYARAFWLDPTHVKPVHPVYLDFVLRAAGFSDVVFEWTALPADAERLVESSDASATMNENVRRLNGLVFGAQNYRIIATR